MPGTYKVIEVVGTSPVSLAEAVRAAVAEAAHTVRHMQWFEVVEPESGAFDDLRSALKARLKGLPRGL
jgi:flavin-binding protein dodecin